MDTNQELNIQTEQMIEKLNGFWKCRVCGKISDINRQNMLRHAETHIEGVSHVCHICSKASSTRASLRDHMYNTHSGIFSCELCGKAGMNRRSYRKHNQINHKALLNI